MSKRNVIMIKMSFFCVFFPLWDNIYPYTCRGASIISNRLFVPEHILFSRRKPLQYIIPMFPNVLSFVCTLLGLTQKTGRTTAFYSIFSLGYVLLYATFNLHLNDSHFISLSNRNRRCCKNEFCNTSKTRINMKNSNYFTITFCPLMT